MVCYICRQALCVIVKSQDDVKAFVNYQLSDAAGVSAAPPPAAPAAAPAPPQAAPAAAAPAMAAPLTGDGRIVASPFAKKLAADKGIDLRVSILFA